MRAESRVALGEDYAFSFRGRATEIAPAPSKWDQLRRAKELLPELGRFHACHDSANKRAHTVSVYAKADKAWFSGVMRCGSVWICPVCARRIAEGRRAELQQAIDNAVRMGYGVMLVTLTFPHGVGDVLLDILQKFTKAQDSFKSGRAAAALRQKIGFKGEIRALEVTHGVNGWHPHAHSIWITSRPLTGEQQEKLRADLYLLWRSACVRNGLPEPSAAHGVDVRGARYAGEYVAKWGFATEVAGGTSKRGKKESAGRTPWQLLSDATEGDQRAAWLWREFALAFFGKRQLFWSKRKTGRKIKRNVYRKSELSGKRVKIGERVADEWISIREELRLAPELTEQQLMDLDDERSRQVAVLDLDTWYCVRKAGAQSDVLQLAATDPSQLWGYLNFLRSTVPMEDGRPPGPREDWEL